jgi:hypothetical protein
LAEDRQNKLKEKKSKKEKKKSERTSKDDEGTKKKSETKKRKTEVSLVDSAIESANQKTSRVASLFSNEGFTQGSSRDMFYNITKSK